MFEFPSISKDVVYLCPTKQFRESSARLVQLKAIADKLMQANWQVEWTITGLAFSPPWEHQYDQSPTAVRKLLDGLNVREPFRQRRSRTLLEIMGDRVEYSDRVWYAQAERGVRSTFEFGDMNWEDQEYVTETIEKMLEKENEYTRKDLVVGSEFKHSGSCTAACRRWNGCWKDWPPWKRRTKWRYWTPRRSGPLPTGHSPSKACTTCSLKGRNGKEPRPEESPANPPRSPDGSPTYPATMANDENPCVLG